MSVEVLKQIWPEWQIDEKPLGKGSYGVVYKAVRKDHNVESYAAIKVISIPADSSEVELLRSEGIDMNGTRTYLQAIVNDFVSEIQLMESLKGVQNIVSVEDYKVVEKTNELGWYVYIRMELLTPFNTYICDKKLTEEEIIKLGCDICTALEICAKRNIIHRDVKPENIFINDFGYFKLGDFGIARKMENVTGGFSQKGTFNYMAPEVASSSEYDSRVDTYSLGIVLYRLLNSNRLPFLDTEKQLLNPNERRNAVDRRIRGEELPPPCEASPAMADLILRACAYDPDKRFSSAAEMKRALMRIASGNYQSAAAELNRTTPVPKADAETECDKTTSVRRAPAASEPSATPVVNTFDPTPEKEEIIPVAAESNKNRPPRHSVDKVKPKKQKTDKANAKKGKSPNFRRFLVLSSPLVSLLMYAAFYVLLIPALYGKAVSFTDWLLADVNHIFEAVQDVNSIFVSLFVIILLVILQYILLGIFLLSVFLFAKELHNPREKTDRSVKYPGKTARMMLEDVLMALKNKPSASDKSAIDNLKTVVDSLKYSKAFGISNNTKVIALEIEMCQLIDQLQETLASDSDESVKKASDYIVVLKQKNTMRDIMLKK